MFSEFSDFFSVVEEEVEGSFKSFLGQPQLKGTSASAYICARKIRGFSLNQKNDYFVEPSREARIFVGIGISSFIPASEQSALLIDFCSNFRVSVSPRGEIISLNHSTSLK